MSTVTTAEDAQSISVIETSPQSADAIVAEDVPIVMAAAKIIFFIIHSLLDYTVHQNSVTIKCADDQSNSPRIKIFFVFFRNGMVRVERIEHIFFYVLLVYFIPIISGAYNIKCLLGCAVDQLPMIMS